MALNAGRSRQRHHLAGAGLARGPVQPEGQLCPATGLPPCRPPRPNSSDWSGGSRRLTPLPDADEKHRARLEPRERDVRRPARGMTWTPRSAIRSRRRARDRPLRGGIRAGLVGPAAATGSLTLAILATAFGLLLGLGAGSLAVEPGPVHAAAGDDRRLDQGAGTAGICGPPAAAAHLPGPVKHAWIAVAAREGFEVCVNRNPVGRFYQWRPTRPFQTGLSEGGQVINPSPALLALNFPREYQWASHRNDWLPVFIDITPAARAGPERDQRARSSRGGPRRRCGSTARSRSGRASGSGWTAGPNGWPSRSRRSTVGTTGPSRSIPTPTGATPSTWRALRGTRPTTTSSRSTTEVLTTPFTGHWLRHAEARSTDTVWFRGEWSAPQGPGRRLDPAGDRPLVRPLRQRPAGVAGLSRHPGPGFGRLGPGLASRGRPARLGRAARPRRGRVAVRGRAVRVSPPR